MKRRGSLLIEVVISIVIFLVGLLALAGSLTLSLKMTVQSGEATKAEQEAVNGYNQYMLRSTIKHDVKSLNDTKLQSYFGANDVTNSSAYRQGCGTSIKIGTGAKTSEFKVYRFYTEGKKGSDIYVLQGSN